MNSARKNHAYGINLAVAQVLTEERKAHGITNEMLAAKLPDMSLTSVQRYLTGRSAIDVEVLSAICRAIGVDEGTVIAEAQRRAHPPRGRAAMQKMEDKAARNESAPGA